MNCVIPQFDIFYYFNKSDEAFSCYIITTYLDEPEKLQRVTVAVIQGGEEATRYTLLTLRLMEDIDSEVFEGMSVEQLVLGASEFTTESREVAEALVDIGIFDRETVDFHFPENENKKLHNVH